MSQETIVEDVTGEPTVLAYSAAEDRFEWWRQTVGLFAGPAVFLIVWFLPFSGLTLEAHRLAAIVSLVVVWWITEAIPIPATALLGAALTVVCGVAGATEAFAPFASPTIFLFMGSFIIGSAIAEHRLDRHLAFALLALPGVRGDVNRIRLAMAALTVVVSAWMSNTATTAMMLPVALGVLHAGGGLSGGRRNPNTTGFLLSIAYAAGIGGLMTPVGSPPNLITIGLLERTAGVRIDFVTWMALAVPISVALAATMYVMGNWMFRAPKHSAVAQDFIEHEQAAARVWTPGKRNCLIAFFTAVVLWITPGLLTLFGGAQSPTQRLLITRLDEGVVAIVAATLLFVLPTDWSKRQFTLGWSEAARIDWGTILLFGGGLSMGGLMFKTGLAGHLGGWLVATTGATSLWGVTAVALVGAVLLTEITSNTAATNMLVPVVITICQAGHLNPIPPAMATCFGASMAFMLPISTPPNAIVYGSGCIRITDMLRFGILLDVVGAVIVFLGLRLLCPLLGLA